MARFAKVMEQNARLFIYFAFRRVLLCIICLIHLLRVTSPQAMLMRQQERLEGRVVNIDERLAKLESDRTLMKVQDRTAHTGMRVQSCCSFVNVCPNEIPLYRCEINKMK